jgi:hypothetical protein
MQSIGARGVDMTGVFWGLAEGASKGQQRPARWPMTAAVHYGQLDNHMKLQFPVLNDVAR